MLESPSGLRIANFRRATGWHFRLFRECESADGDFRTLRPSEIGTRAEEIARSIGESIDDQSIDNRDKKGASELRGCQARIHARVLLPSLRAKRTKSSVLNPKRNLKQKKLIDYKVSRSE